MSGNACLIIIRGNRSQSIARSFANQFAHDDVLVAAANDTQSIAQSLCTLSAGYSENGIWEDLMTDAQKTQATTLMGDFNSVAGELVAYSGRSPEVLSALNQFNAAGNALLTAISNNP